MSKYTTGEVAKICNVTVRTVQYYDTRGILVPSELSDGGRRLYSEDDLRKMRVICFLRELSLPINTISQILSDDDASDVVLLLLTQHQEQLKEQLADTKQKLESIVELKAQIESSHDFSLNTIEGVAQIMKTKEKMKKVRINMAIYAVTFGVAEIVTMLLLLLKGIWIPFVIVYVLAMLTGFLWLTPYYYKKTAYICPTCHETFKPKFSQMFWANHTPTTRKLTCPHCEEKKWCVETYDENSD